MSTATSGFGTLFASAGGGGGTVIPNDGTLSGTYTGNVYCDGAATITGDVTIKGGNLYVLFGLCFAPFPSP